ncbi:MAG TPA: HEAT repeat domain-containing protein [Vicinamibacterales bacterium]
MHVKSSVLVLCAVLAVSMAAAQQPFSQGAATAGPAVGANAVALANGWAMVAEGAADRAATRAAEIMASDPRSGAALHLALEAQIARSGAAGALTWYETWLASRTMDEPAAVRRIAQAMLREEATARTNVEARVLAMRTLLAEGDRWASDELARLAASPGTSPQLLAQLGYAEAVGPVVAGLESGHMDPVKALDVLGATGNRAAARAVEARLGDARQEVRAAAADALGRIGSADDAEALRRLLADRSLHVRLKAAGALLRLGDFSGLPFLQELLTDASPSIRLAAADAMASQPDAGWQATLIDLTREPDPEIQASAARLLAPHDPATARAVLESLAQHENPAIRDLAAAGLSEVIADDLPSLRRSMHESHPLIRVRAAARVLHVTR